MVVIAVGDSALALEIGKLIPGEKTYVLPTETATKMRHRVHEAQPEAIILDVTLGGQRWSAMTQIPKLLAVRSAPALVLLSPRASRDVDRAAAAWGCYDVVIRRADDGRTARAVAEKVHDAQAWRADQSSSGVPVGESLH